ncbi:hypothetical protein GGR50DRAFT_646682 [Xylaria sp. CBS 124048]|nr:hypothetical protein GGR50DRAFT_646682 [Xylaria sp. CBS 124048]
MRRKCHSHPGRGNGLYGFIICRFIQVLTIATSQSCTLEVATELWHSLSSYAFAAPAATVVAAATVSVIVGRALVPIF